MSLYELLRGPLLWVAFGVFFSGMVVRVVLFFQLSRQKDKPIYRFFSWTLAQERLQTVSNSRSAEPSKLTSALSVSSC